MEHVDVWIGAHTAATIMNISRQYCYKLSDESVLVSRHDKEKKRLLFSLQSIISFLRITPDETFFSDVVAADSGSANAMLEIGLFFLERKLEPLAFSCIRSAAAGDPDAMDWVSKCYVEGIGVPPNLALGLRWLGDAAAHGHPIALAKLAVIEQGASLQEATKNSS